MTRVLIFLMACSVAALGQSSTLASFPTKVPTDAELLDVVNRYSTTLTAGIAAGDLSIPVAAVPSLAVGASMTVTIDNEIIKISGVAGPNLTVATGGRGFDGTAAAAHSSGAAVKGTITGYHHRRLAGEIEGIAGALGANLSSIGYLLSTRFDFAAQTPAASLTAAVDATITLTPVPWGVNWNDTDHNLYIVDAVAGNEVVSIKAAGPGTATGGAATGTITLTGITLNHTSGNWTIRSASAGIQEALHHTAQPHVMVPSGTHTVRATITPPAGATIEGAGGTYSGNAGAATEIVYYDTDTPLFLLTNDHITLKHMVLSGNGGGAAIAGSIGISARNCGDATYVLCPATWQSVTHRLEDLYVRYFYKGVKCDGSANSTVLGLWSYQNNENGVETSCQGSWTDLFAQRNAGDGFRFIAATDGGGAVPWISGLQTHDNGGWGIQSTTSLNINGCYVNFDKSGEVLLNSATYENLFANCHVEQAGVSPTYGTTTTSPGIQVSGTAILLMSNLFVNTSQGKGIALGTAGNTLINSRVLSNGAGAAPAGDNYGIDDAGGWSRISNNYLGGAYKFDVGGSIITDNSFVGNSAALPLVQFACTSGSCPHYTYTDNTVNKSAGAAVAEQFDASTVFRTPRQNYIVAGGITNNSTVAGRLTLGVATAANLASYAATANVGDAYLCTDCQVTDASDNTCKAGGTGALGVRINGAWRCFANQN